MKGLLRLGLATVIALSLSSTGTLAATPPGYLYVPYWKSCAKTYRKRGATFYCLPDRRPFGCPRASWRSLNDNYLMDRCPRRGDYDGGGIGSSYDGGGNDDNGNGIGSGLGAPAPGQ